jgi:GNAT superfamily N-acetyltransferase
MLTYAQATSVELPTVLDILDDAAARLARQGIEQWPARFSGVKDWRSLRIRKYVEAGQAWLVRLDGETVGTVSLTEESDPDFADGWPDGPDDALYLYRMAVRRAYAGKAIGTEVLNWASERAGGLGKRWLRLDCHRRNLALQQYYERHGFDRVGTVVHVVNTETDEPFTRNSGALYQRAAGTTCHPTERQTSAMTDRYDPTGEAAVWLAASSLVTTLKRDDDASDAATWNAAIAQASRVLEDEARGIRQRDGMYFRPISGSARDAARLDAATS